MTGRLSFPFPDPGLRERILNLRRNFTVSSSVELDVGGIGGTPGRGAGLAPPPRRGVRWLAPGTSRFGAVQSAEVGSGAVSAGGSAAGRGVGAADRVPDPTPDLPRSPHRAPEAAPPRPARLTRSPFSLELAGRRAGGAGDPAGAEAWQAGGEARLRPPRHVRGPRHQRPLPFAPPSLEQRLPAAGAGAAGPGEGRGGVRPGERRTEHSGVV